MKTNSVVTNIKTALRDKGRLSVSDVARAMRVDPKLARSRVRRQLRAAGHENEIGERQRLTTVSSALRVAKLIEPGLRA